MHELLWTIPSSIRFPKNRIEIIFRITCMEDLDFCVELSLHHFIKKLEQVMYLKFFLHEECPSETRVIIYEYYKSFCSS